MTTHCRVFLRLEPAPSRSTAGAALSHNHPGPRLATRLSPLLNQTRRSTPSRARRNPNHPSPKDFLATNQCRRLRSPYPDIPTLFRQHIRRRWSRPRLQDHALSTSPSLPPTRDKTKPPHFCSTVPSLEIRPKSASRLTRVSPCGLCCLQRRVRTTTDRQPRSLTLRPLPFQFPVLSIVGLITHSTTPLAASIPPASLFTGTARRVRAAPAVTTLAVTTLAATTAAWTTRLSELPRRGQLCALLKTRPGSTWRRERFRCGPQAHALLRGHRGGRILVKIILTLHPPPPCRTAVQNCQSAGKPKFHFPPELQLPQGAAGLNTWP